jgi:hypothetical protein
MRGEDEGSEGLFSYVSCSARVPKDHPQPAKTEPVMLISNPIRELDGSSRCPPAGTVDCSGVIIGGASPPSFHEKSHTVVPLAE